MATKVNARGSPVAVRGAALPRQSAAARIATELRAQLLDGHLSPGDRLPPIKDLAGQFGVSVPTMREAVSSLVHRGLLEAFVGVGTFVAEPADADAARAAWQGLPDHEADFLEFLEARRILEPHQAALAARRATSQQIGRLRALVTTIRGVFDQTERAPADAQLSDRAAELDTQFHDLVAEAADNRVLRRALQVAYQPLQVEYARLRRLLTPEVANLRLGYELHEQLVDALEHRDEARAAAVAHQIASLADSWHRAIGPGVPNQADAAHSSGDGRLLDGSPDGSDQGRGARAGEGGTDI